MNPGEAKNWAIYRFGFVLVKLRMVNNKKRIQIYEDVLHKYIREPK
jgi:hypothetical protein